MNGTIPRHPAWCSDCVTAKAPCSNHGGPDGPREYKGPDVYVPSDWVLEVVGKTYKGLYGTYTCFGYDPRNGFWMRNITNPQDERNISERAIGRTYHQVRNERSTEPSRREHMQWCKKRALEYLATGDWASAMASMASDLTKHPETITLIETMALGVATVRGLEDARKFIEGFAD